jgi:hypothetical protein
MFNLGYLPGSDKNCITKSETTLPALAQSLEILKPGGLLSIMLYPGHAGGDTEASAVIAWSKQVSGLMQREHLKTAGPQWLLLQKTA